MGRSLTVLVIVALALAASSCRDEDLDGVVASAAREASRAEAARLHAGATFLVSTFTEVDGVEPLAAATGFDVIVPRQLPEGIEVQWVFAQRELDDSEPDGPEAAIASLTMSRAGGQVLLQLSESRGGDARDDRLGEQVAIGDHFGWLSVPANDAPSNTAATLAFDGCGLNFRLLAVSADDPPGPFTADELVAIAEATLDACPTGGVEDSGAGPRYFLGRTIEVGNVDELSARLGEDAVLPSYLPRGAASAFVRGFPLLPGADGEPDSADVLALYELASGNVLLTESKGLPDREAGFYVYIGGVGGQLSHESSESALAQTTLAWESCGLGFSLVMTSFPRAPVAPALADEELIRIAESIVEQCD